MDIFVNPVFDVNDFVVASSDIDDVRLQIEKAFATFGLWDAESAAASLGAFPDSESEPEHDEDEELLADVMNIAGLDVNDDDDSDTPTSNDTKYFPYDSKTMFLLDVLSNLPRQRISQSMMRIIIWVLRETGARDVPSFDRLRKVQTKLRAECGVPTLSFTSTLGNVFYLNDPRTLIAKDWATAEIRKQIRVYPEIPEDGVIREIWHAEKWRRGMDTSLLSPMFDASGKHYYVDELAMLDDKRLVIPQRWVTFRRRVYADALEVIVDHEGLSSVLDRTIFIDARKLMKNYLDLEFEGKLPHWPDNDSHASKMPNPKRAIAGGDPLYVSFIEYFSDDVSGNRSKQWNKHWNVYMTHRNLPRALIRQEFHVHFVSSSPHASVMEQYAAFKKIVEATHKDPVKVRDGESGTQIRFMLQKIVDSSDNPMQSEIAANIGSKGNYPCRKCEVGGTQAEKRENEGYHALFEAGTLRSKESIVKELEEQVRLACAGVAQPIKDRQSSTGIKDAYTEYWIRDLISRYQAMKSDPKNTKTPDEIQKELIEWTVENRDTIYSGFLTTEGFDPTRDTPIEILHTILLGVVKYIWHSTHTSFSPEQKLVYSRRLQATNTDALSVHFKMLVQANIFHIRDLVSDDQFVVWKAVGELGALLWFPEIRNLKEYIIFEAFNGVFRSCSIFSNHLAPSRDIALQLGAQEALKHRLMSGWWPVGESDWQRAGTGIQDFVQMHPHLRGLLGWSDVHSKQAGMEFQTFEMQTPLLIILAGSYHLKAAPKNRTRTTIKLSGTVAALALNYASYTASSEWYECAHIISESSEECYETSWVFYISPFSTTEKKLSVGRIASILAPPSAKPPTPAAAIVIEVFRVSESRDETYGMPVLVRPDGEKVHHIVAAESIKFKFNVQHDCASAGCAATGERNKKQERQDSAVVEKFIIHCSDERFFVNLHAFHNAHLVRAALPRDLVKPIPISTDRKELHDRLAKELRDRAQIQAALLPDDVDDDDDNHDGFSSSESEDSDSDWEPRDC
ncbi:hypothetical protein BDZ89DRAFT_1217262 [Hymenopellis radicata]|nr:hypothetical protein BDZ89DRAFT_1217262 [Hymenopellis radicata]